MPANLSVSFTARMSNAATSIAVGKVVCTDSSGDYVIATTANRAAAGSIAGVAITAASALVKTFAVQGADTIPSSITGLGAGTASAVTVNSTGDLVRNAAPTYGSDFIVGDCDVLGNLYVHLGISQISPPAGGGGGGSPGGSGTQMQYRAGASTFGGLSGAEADTVNSRLRLISGLAFKPGANEGLVQWAPGGARTLTLPDATDTLVGQATADTLTNKTINGASNTLTVRIANDVSGLGTGVATWLGTPSGANLASALTTALPDTKGGTGLTALGTGVATFLGTPSGANLATALTTALPASKGGTGLTALGTNVATWLGTPSGANLAAALTSALPVSKGGTNQTALGTANQVLRTNAGATDTEWATISGGTPAGSNTYVQFNDSGAFGGDANLLWDKVTQLFSSLVRFRAAQFELAMKTDSASSGTLNNYSLGGRYGILLFTNAAAITLNGIVAPSPGTGQVLFVIATGAGGIIFADEAAGSTAANRLRIGAGTGAAVSVAVPLIYNTDESRWRQVAYVNY